MILLSVARNAIDNYATTNKPGFDKEIIYRKVNKTGMQSVPKVTISKINLLKTNSIGALLFDIPIRQISTELTDISCERVLRFGRGCRPVSD